MRRVAAAALALGCWLAGAEGQEAAPPDLEFFEYLGTWAEDDEEWLAIEEGRSDELAEPDEEPEGPERPERERDEDDDDESE